MNTADAICNHKQHIWQLLSLGMYCMGVHVTELTRLMTLHAAGCVKNQRSTTVRLQFACKHSSSRQSSSKHGTNVLYKSMAC